MNLSSNVSEGLLSVYDDGYDEGCKEVISLIENYEETEILSLQSRIVIRMLLGYIRENVNNE